MDTLTHALIGTAASDGFFRRRLGPLATPFALVASSLPDIDSVTYLMSPEHAWAYHRGITHSFLPMLAAAPVLGYLGYRLSRREGTWLLWSLLALVCLYLHTIFDLVTSWGTMPFLPFSNARISWDIVPIIDIFLTAVTAASFVANRILRWERIDYFINPLTFPIVHRHPRRQAAANWVGRIAVALVAVYVLIGWHQNRQTVRLAREELARAGVEAVDVRAMPILFTYVAWNIAARDADGRVHNAVYSSYARAPMRFVEFSTAPAAELAPVLATPEGGMFAWYSQGMYVGDTDAPDGADGEGGVRRVRLHDRRFFTLTNPAASAFVMEFAIGPDGTVAAARASQRALDGLDIREELRRLWELTRHGRDMNRIVPINAEVD